MRELKFRAWDKENKKFSLLPQEYQIKEINYYTDYEWMQYTGLKDKNGTEIYEGDICIVSLSYFKIKDEKAIVIFHNGAFQFQYGYEKSFSKPHDAWDEVEVIGNIYENKELLN